MTIELVLLCTAIGCAIGVAGFFGGKQSAAKKEGEQWGAFQAELRTDVGHIKDDIADIKMQVKISGEQYANIRTDVEVVKRDLKTAFSKIDDIKGTK